MRELGLDSVKAAQRRLASVIHPTPLIRSNWLSRRLARPVWLKLETQHPTGSFKFRPALNGILTHLAESRQRGVLCSSSGNFAQAVAYASREWGCSSQIVMTSTTSPYKIERTRAWGAEVVLCGPTFKDRWETTDRLRRETGRVFLHPYDSDETISADGTIALEAIDQLRAVAEHGALTGLTFLVPVSGGGLVSGISLAAKGELPACRVYGVQPAGNASLKKSLEAGRRVEVPAFQSLADALVAVTPGERTFEICKKWVDDVLLVEESAILNAQKWLFEEQKLVAEAGGVVGLAALLSWKVPTETTPLVIILSGGNTSAPFKPGQ